MNKIFEYIVAFLALIGLGALAVRRQPTSPAKENAKVDEKMKEIQEEVNAQDTASVVDDYNKRHGKS